MTVLTPLPNDVTADSDWVRSLVSSLIVSALVIFCLDVHNSKQDRSVDTVDVFVFRQQHIDGDNSVIPLLSHFYRYLK